MIWNILQKFVTLVDSPSMNLAFHILLSISLKENKEDEEEKEKYKTRKSSVIGKKMHLTGANPIILVDIC